MATSKFKTSSTRLIVERAYSSSQGTTNANSARTVTINVAKSGYTPLGLVGATTFHSFVLLQEFSLEGDTAKIIMRNVSTANATHYTGVWVLYAQNE